MFCGCHAHCGTQKNNVYGTLVEGILISEAEEGVLNSKLE